MTSIIDYDEWKLLYTCMHEQEADMLESFLQAENIDTLRKYPGFSDMVRIIGGTTNLGVSIYVKESRLKEAGVILKDILQYAEDDLKSEDN